MKDFGTSIIFLFTITLIGCSHQKTEYHDWPPLKEKSIEQDSLLLSIGKNVFYEKSISINGKTSCSTCHVPKKSFADGYERALSRNILLSRNTPTTLNINRYKSFFWDGRARSLNEQIKSPLLSLNELGSNPELLKKYFHSDSVLYTLLEVRYGIDFDPVQVATDALESYLIELSTKKTKYDYYRNDLIQLNNSEKMGESIFFGKGRCIQCHKPPDFTDNDFHDIGLPRRKIILEGTNDGTFELGFDLGRGNIENGIENKFKFRTPSLVNVSKTEPYMHDGTFRNLEEVIDFYDRGNEVINPVIGKLNLSKEEKEALKSFLNTLNEYDVEIQLTYDKLNEQNEP